MIYEFKITEVRTATVAVKAQNSDEAQKIFTEWYEKHEDDPVIDEMLENGYDGRKFERSVGYCEESYDREKASIFLPEEQNTPQEQKMYLHIRFADGSKPITFWDKTFREIGLYLTQFSDKYYLRTDECFNEPEGGLCLYAVLKEQPETWYSFDEKIDRK